MNRARDVIGIKKFFNILKLYEIIPKIKAATNAIIKLSIHLNIVENTSNINLSSDTISFILLKTCSKVGKYISLFIFKAIISHKNNRITHESATCILFLS